jgi:hypothetical protein
MATSLVHVGDFHAAPGPRNEARFRALDQLIAEASQLPSLGAWLWPGDLSHQRQAIEDENAIIIRLQRMARLAPVVIVYGNHDQPGDLDKFSEVKAAHEIYVVDRPTVLRVRLATMAFASIACLPYPHKHGLVMAGCANPDIVDAAADHLDALFMQFAATLEQARATGDLTLFIGHVNVGGAITSSGQPNIGREIEISPRHLDRLGHLYKGLNHIHKAQEIHGAHYPGSICRLDWGEVEEKRWIEVLFEDTSNALGKSWMFGVVSHAIDVAPLYYTEGELTRDGYTYDVIAGPGGAPQPKPASWKGCEVRARYRVKASERGVVDKSLVAREYADAALFHPDPITIPDRQLRAPEVAAAKTLPDKVAAWCALAGTVASEGVLQKLAWLENGDPEYAVIGARDHAADIASGHFDDKKATVAA